MATRETYFSLSEAEILIGAYEVVKEQIQKKDNTTDMKQRDKCGKEL